MIYVAEFLEKSTRVHEQCFRFLNFVSLTIYTLVSRSCSLQIIGGNADFQLLNSNLTLSDVFSAAEMSQPRKSTVIDWQQRIPTDSSPLRANDRKPSFVCLLTGAHMGSCSL